MVAKKGLKDEKVGVKVVSTEGYTMECVDYNSYTDITVRFEDGHEVKSTWHNFTKGSIKNVYHKSVYGVGYIGEGDYSSKGYRTPKFPMYRSWISMMRRCYSDTDNPRDRAYKQCSVNSIWHNFQNFCLWYEYNYYEIEGETMCLDKDILVKGNKTYAPKTAVFVPESINKLFLTRKDKRGHLPIGVYERPNGKFGAYLSKGDKRVHLGYFGIPHEAFLAYKEAKEQHIKEVAEKYKHHIPIKLYDALLRYEVEMDD